MSERERERERECVCVSLCVCEHTTKELDELMASLSEFKVRVSVCVGRWLVSVCMCLEVCVCVFV